MHSCLGKKPSPEQFAKWCKQRSIFLHPDIAFLVPTKTMGCGVFARKPLPAGTVVVECPASSSVSPYVEPSADAPSIAALQQPAYESIFREDPLLFVVLRLMAELCRGSASAWRPWLEVCPRMREHWFDVSARADLDALGLEEGEEEEAGAGAKGNGAGVASSSPATAPSLSVSVNPLRWTTVSQQLREMRVRARWRVAEQRVMAHHRDLWPAHSATFPLFCECLAQVSSRNFHREEIPDRAGPYLLPGLDVLNHSAQPNCGFHMRGGGRKHSCSFTVVVERPLQRGEQVYCSYGRIGAARFALEFQFCTAAVLRENTVRFSAEALAEAAALLIAPCPAGEPEGRATELAAPGVIPARCAVPPDVLADMTYRVDRLQRLGVLFDEGLYLLQPCAADSANEKTLLDAIVTAAASDAASGTADLDGVGDDALRARAVECGDNLRTLMVVAYLLLAVPRRDEFDTVFHTMSRDWLPPPMRRAPPPQPNSAPTSPGLSVLVQLVERLLEVKRNAASHQDSLVDTLEQDRAADGPRASAGDASAEQWEKVPAAVLERRRELLHSVLQSEQQVLTCYVELARAYEKQANQ